jgi:hypothetical protein
MKKGFLERIYKTFKWFVKTLFFSTPIGSAFETYTTGIQQTPRLHHLTILKQFLRKVVRRKRISQILESTRNNYLCRIRTVYSRLGDIIEDFTLFLSIVNCSQFEKKRILICTWTKRKIEKGLK